MRQPRRPGRFFGVVVPALLVATLAIAAAGGFRSNPAATGPVPVRSTRATTAAVSTTPTPTPTTAAPTPTTAAPTPTTAAAPLATARVFASGNARLDAMLQTLPGVLFSGGATVHFGYNPVDCCHAGGYNPGPNEVWVSERALKSNARLVYVTVHELAHSVHLHSARAAALTAAVAGAPVVRAGSRWDDSEKVADCVAWALYPTETAASGLTYWNCPDPWRSQVRTALFGS